MYTHFTQETKEYRYIKCKKKTKNGGGGWNQLCSHFSSWAWSSWNHARLPKQPGSLSFNISFIAWELRVSPCFEHLRKLTCPLKRDYFSRISFSEDNQTASRTSSIHRSTEILPKKRRGSLFVERSRHSHRSSWKMDGHAPAFITVDGRNPAITSSGWYFQGFIQPYDFNSIISNQHVSVAHCYLR